MNDTEVAALLRALERDVELAETLLATSDRLGDPGDLRACGYLLIRLGGAMVSGRDASNARTHLPGALAMFRRIRRRFGMAAPPRTPVPASGDAAGTPDGASVEPPAAVGRPTADDPAAGAGVLEVLTPREREVAELVAAGLTNRRIAERIVVAERTVDTHVQRILAKLSCASRVQVAVLVATERE